MVKITVQQKLSILQAKPIVFDKKSFAVALSGTVSSPPIRQINTKLHAITPVSLPISSIDNSETLVSVGTQTNTGVNTVIQTSFTVFPKSLGNIVFFYRYISMLNKDSMNVTTVALPDKTIQPTHENESTPNRLYLL